MKELNFNEVQDVSGGDPVTFFVVGFVAGFIYTVVTA